MFHAVPHMPATITWLRILFWISNNSHFHLPPIPESGGYLSVPETNLFWIPTFFWENKGNRGCLKWWSLNLYPVWLRMKCNPEQANNIKNNDLRTKLCNLHLNFSLLVSVLFNFRERFTEKNRKVFPLYIPIFDVLVNKYFYKKSKQHTTSYWNKQYLYYR